MRKPFGKSIFQPKQYVVKVTDKVTVGPVQMDFNKLHEYYNNDPVAQNLMNETKKLEKENKWKEPWYMDMYQEIWHQIMLYGDVVDIDKLREIAMEKMTVYP